MRKKYLTAEERKAAAKAYYDKKLAAGYYRERQTQWRVKRGIKTKKELIGELRAYEDIKRYIDEKIAQTKEQIK